MSVFSRSSTQARSNACISRSDRTTGNVRRAGIVGLADSGHSRPNTLKYFRTQYTAWSMWDPDDLRLSNLL